MKQANTLTRYFTAIAYTLAPLLSSSQAHSQDSDKNVIPHIYAAEDAQVLKSCPQITTVETKTIPVTQDEHFNVIFNSNIPSAYMLMDGLFSKSLVAKNFAETIDEVEFGMVAINSIGGSTSIEKAMLPKLSETQTPVATIAYDYALSVAFTILIHGNYGKRYVHDDTKLMVHEASYMELGRTIDDIETIEDLKDLPNFDEIRQIFEEEGFIDDEDVVKSVRETLISANNFMRESFVERSTTGLSEDCANALLRGGYDMRLNPQIALKLGLIDAILDDFYNRNTMTVRADDPRVIGP